MFSYQEVINIIEQKNIINHLSQIVRIQNKLIPNDNLINYQVITGNDANIALKLIFNNVDAAQIIADHLFLYKIGSSTNGLTQRKQAQNDGVNQWAVYIRNDQLQDYCNKEKSTFYEISCDEAKNIIRTNKGLIRIIQTTKPGHTPNSPLKAIDYFLEQVEDPINCRKSKPQYMTGHVKKDDTKHYWDPTDGKLYLRKVPITFGNPAPKPPDYKYAKKESFSLLPPDGKMALISRTEVEELGILFDLNESLLKVSENTGQHKYVFELDASTGTLFWLGADDNGRTRKRATTLAVIITKHNNKTKDEILPYNEILPCVSKEGFKAIFSNKNTLDSRLHLLFYQEYLERKYPFILQNYPHGLPLLVITPQDGVQAYTIANQINDYFSGLTSQRKFAIDLDKSYFINLVAKNLNSHNALKLLSMIEERALRLTILEQAVAYNKFLSRNMQTALIIKLDKINQLRKNNNLDVDQAIAWQALPLCIWLLQGQSLKLPMNIFLKIASYIANLELSHEFCEKKTFRMRQQFLINDLRNAASTSFGFFAQHQKKAESLLQAFEKENNPQMLTKILESQERDDFYRLVTERHHKRLS